MFEAIAEVVLGFIAELLAGVFWWLVLFPVVWLVSLPFILVLALFRRQPYWFAVSVMLIEVHASWREAGPFILP